MPSTGRYIYLFGHDKPWDTNSWVASDDRVRGGKSQSHLTSSPGSAACFHGELDITALGGAGFASQRSPDSMSWDLSDCQGLRLKVKQGDGKKYTLILKDGILPKRPDGREQSTVSWEYDFTASSSSASSSSSSSSGAAELDIRWTEFKPTYRGKPKSDAEPLKLEAIKRLSIMMRSFFGEQEGPFRLQLEYIAAIAKSSDSNRQSGSASSGSDLSEKPQLPNDDNNSRPRGDSWVDYLCGFLR
ncbi:CIA30 family protein [Xylariomycetidae sp. FL2044]|nr:CIA30 family protein [Xylariomycetidae sp. FL2044]